MHLLNHPSVSLPYTVTDQINVTVAATAPHANDSVVCVEVQGMPLRASAMVFQNVDYDADRAVLPLGSHTSSQLSEYLMERRRGGRLPFRRCPPLECVVPPGLLRSGGIGY
ncbi:hypothetical protein [Streptomyces sp. NPDC057438]|uniref:hypothetical protein n=1 Tax=Streptomyces sp. NPDC057438 TaxID=3346133 RepID=UPI0036741B0D